MALNVNYGCGTSAAEDWLNYDASPTLRLSKVPIIGNLALKKTPFPRIVQYGDVTKRLPLGDCTADRVYCSHVLEHLSFDDFHRALEETFRIMKAGAVFRGVMPDLEIEVRRYLDNNQLDAAYNFMKDTHLGIKARPRGLTQRLVSNVGNSAHLWLWDYKALEQALTAAGFRDVRRAYIGDSDDEAFASVEDNGRWANNLGWMCRKG